MCDVGWAIFRSSWELCTFGTRASVIASVSGHGLGVHHFALKISNVLGKSGKFAIQGIQKTAKTCAILGNGLLW